MLVRDVRCIHAKQRAVLDLRRRFNSEEQAQAIVGRWGHAGRGHGLLSPAGRSGVGRDSARADWRLPDRVGDDRKGSVVQTMQTVSHRLTIEMPSGLNACERLPGPLVVL